VGEIRRSVGDTRNSGWKILDRNWEIQTDPEQIKEIGTSGKNTEKSEMGDKG
jgi:hypothetical protein